MNNYVKKALALHAKGYNCAQAVICAFEDKAEVDSKTLYMLAEGFGAGIGNRNNICGALSGAVMLAGAVESAGDVNTPSKMDTYKKSGRIAEIFEEKCKAVACCDIKGLKTGTPTVSCEECIVIAVEAANEILFG